MAAERVAQQAAQRTEQNAAAEGPSLKEAPRSALTWEEVEGVRKAINALTTEEPEELAGPDYIYLRHAHGILAAHVDDQSFFIDALGGHGLRGDMQGIMRALEHETRSRGCTALECLVRDPRLKKLCERKLGMQSRGVLYQADLWDVKKKSEDGKETGLFKTAARLLKRTVGIKDGKETRAPRLKFGRAGRQAAREARFVVSQRAALETIKPEELTAEETDGIRQALYAMSGALYRNVATPALIYLRHPRGIVAASDANKVFFIEALAGRGMARHAREIFALVEIEARRRGCGIVGGKANDPRLMRLCAQLGMKPMAEFYRREVGPVAG